MNNPNYIHSIYDNGGDTADRYTVFTHEYHDRAKTLREALALNDMPTHPSYGFSQFTSGQPGNHCGKLVSFDSLPDNVRIHIESRLT